MKTLLIIYLVSVVLSIINSIILSISIKQTLTKEEIKKHKSNVPRILGIFKVIIFIIIPIFNILLTLLPIFTFNKIINQFKME